MEQSLVYKFLRDYVSIFNIHPGRQSLKAHPELDPARAIKTACSCSLVGMSAAKLFNKPLIIGGSVGAASAIGRWLWFRTQNKTSNIQQFNQKIVPLTQIASQLKAKQSTKKTIVFDKPYQGSARLKVPTMCQKSKSPQEMVNCLDQYQKKVHQ